MKRIFGIIAFAQLMCASPVSAQKGWIDVTDNYIVNPRFEGNDVITGWYGTSFGSANPMENAEHYSKTFNTYQDISGLTAGTYRLSISAFYRAGDSNSDYNHFNNNDLSTNQRAHLYATSGVDNKETAIALASSAALEQSLGGGSAQVGGGWWDYSTAKYIPNNMEGAYYWFEAGHYYNELTVEVGSDGNLTIGIRKNQTINSDWLCCDNWKLEYYGQIIYVNSIFFKEQSFEMGLFETKQLKPIIMPSNATIQKLTWESTDESVVTVDNNGLVTAVGEGEAEIIAFATDGSEEIAYCTITVSNHGATAESLIINEIMPANVDMFIDPSWNYGGWVELYNPTNTSANMGGYYVSDDPNNLKKTLLVSKVGAIPAHGFLTLWFDHADTRKDIGDNWTNTQVDMDLDCDGGTIYISNNKGELIASQDYPASMMRVAWARTTDGGNEWRYTSTPTPNATNNGSTFADERLDEPVVDKNSQLFTGSLQVCVNIPSGATLRYTTDGSTPSLDNGAASSDGLFTVSNSAVYRFRLFKDGYLPSKVVTRSYIYQDRDYYLPIVSVVTDPKNLYDNTIGVYVSGTNGKTANQDYTKRNFNMEWERPVNFEYITEEGEAAFNQEVSFQISGGWSRKYEPRSFKLKAQKEYENNELQYQFFKDKPYNKNKVLLMRNGGNDEYNQTRLKDAALQEIARMSEFKLNLQSYQPTHVFINGEYLAMLNMREPSNKHYGYANYGIDTDEIDAFEMSVDSGYVQKDGTREAFEHWYDLSANANDPEIYKQICDIVDIDDYTNYMAFKFFLNDWDWPHNNTKAFRDRNNGKFKFVVFDLDNCIDRTGNNIFRDFESKRTNTFYGRPEYGGTSITAEVEMVTIFLNMLKNAEFKKKFIDTYCIVGGCVFRDANEIADIVNGIAANIETALSWEGHSPWGNGRSFAQGIINGVTGNFKSTMTNVIKAYGTFGLANTEAQAVTINSTAEGSQLLINGIEVPKAKFDGYLFSPITLTAQTPAGHKFLGWVDEELDSKEYLDIFGMESSWSYYDTGSLGNANWKSASYSEPSWKTGNAPFGYGNAGKPMANAATTLDWGTDRNNKRPTYYFRKKFTLSETPKETDVYTLTYNVDDGMIIYINGQQVGIYHLYDGDSYSTTTEDHNGSWYEGDNPYSSTITIDPSILKKGTNIIAVEVHNCNGTSSDIWWDCSLSCEREKEISGDIDFVSTDAEFEMPSRGSHHYTAVFEKYSEEELLAQGTKPVMINEVSAANSIYVNEYYKKNDWIELYNTQDKSIDVAGMYVTDNIEKPQKYQIPASDDYNTVIPAHGYLVVWCDKLDPLSQVHTSFKLAAEGGFVAITEENNAWADTLKYDAHEGTMSVGRYPDGNSNVYAMFKPTIGFSNTITSADTVQVQEWGDTPIDAGISTLIARNGGMRIMYDGGNIIVKSEEGTNAQLQVFTSVGQICKTDALNLHAGHATSYVGNLPTGIYVAKVKNEDGDVCSCKFVIK